MEVRPPRLHLLHQTRQAGVRVLMIALLALMAACRQPPEMVLQNARDALAELNKTACGDPDRLTESLAVLGQYVEPRSMALLQAAPEVERKSNKQFKVFATCKPPPTVLPAGEVQKVETDEQVARVYVRAAKGGGKNAVVVPMTLVNGRWKIALLDMESFVAAMAVR